MTEPAQPLDLAPIQARCDAARSGPWRLYDDLADDGYPGHLWTVQNRDDEPGDNGIVVSIGTRADGEFIAAARQDVPALIAEVLRLRAQLGAWEDESDLLRRLLREANELIRTASSTEQAIDDLRELLNP